MIEPPRGVSESSTRSRGCLLSTQLSCCRSVWITILCVLPVFVLAVPNSWWIQRQLTFLAPGWPPADFTAPDQPSNFGASPAVSRWFSFHSGLPNTTAHWIEADLTDSPRLGLWLTLPARECNPSSSSPETLVLYSHGMLETRAYPLAVAKVRRLAAPPYCASIVSFDYRGFGDSLGTPSEAGVVDDAARAWDWARARLPGAIGILYGHSLGSGVAVQLAWRLQQRQQWQRRWVDAAAQGEAEGAPVVPMAAQDPAAALVLESAYSSIAEVAASWMPPWLPALRRYVERKVLFRFESSNYARNLSAADGDEMPLRVLQLHATADSVVHREVGRRLFRAFPSELRTRWLESPPPATHEEVFLADANARRACEELWSELRAERARERLPPMSAPE